MMLILLEGDDVRGGAKPRLVTAGYDRYRIQWVK